MKMETNELEEARRVNRNLLEEYHNISGQLSQLQAVAEDLLQAVDYAATLKKPRWVREWLLGSDERHPEHSAISRLRMLVRATKPEQSE